MLEIKFRSASVCSCARSKGQICRKTIRSRQTWPFTDEQYNNARIQQLADMIHHSDPAVPYHKWTTEIASYAGSLLG